MLKDPDEIKNTKKPKDSNSSQAEPKVKSSKKIFKIILVVVLLALAAGGMYFYGESRLDNQNKEFQSEINLLNEEIDALRKKLENEKEVTNEESPVSQTISAELAENIRDAISSGDLAALEGYMEPSVEVILAASGFGGNKTPSEAVEALDYVKNINAEWNFNVDTSLLESWRNGYYSSKLPENDKGVIGLSSDNLVVAFTVNEQQRITRVFMAQKEVMDQQ